MWILGVRLSAGAAILRFCVRGARRGLWTDMIPNIPKRIANWTESWTGTADFLNCVAFQRLFGGSAKPLFVGSIPTRASSFKPF
jgi:hypothetical protein